MVIDTAAVSLIRMSGSVTRARSRTALANASPRAENSSSLAMENRFKFALPAAGSR